jgi:hypothetical protein
VPSLGTAARTSAAGRGDAELKGSGVESGAVVWSSGAAVQTSAAGGGGGRAAEYRRRRMFKGGMWEQRTFGGRMQVTVENRVSQPGPQPHKISGFGNTDPVTAGDGLIASDPRIQQTEQKSAGAKSSPKVSHRRRGQWPGQIHFPLTPVGVGFGTRRKAKQKPASPPQKNRGYLFTWQAYPYPARDSFSSPPCYGRAKPSGSPRGWLQQSWRCCGVPSCSSDAPSPSTRAIGSRNRVVVRFPRPKRL